MEESIQDYISDKVGKDAIIEKQEAVIVAAKNIIEVRTKIMDDARLLLAKVLERCSHSMDSKMLVAIVRMQERLRGK